MTLEEAIIHCEEVASDRAGCCEDCVNEHRQLAEWLKELKRYKEYGPCAFYKHNTFEESAPCFRCPAGMSFAKNKIAKVVEAE